MMLHVYEATQMHKSAKHRTFSCLYELSSGGFHKFKYLPYFLVHSLTSNFWVLHEEVHRPPPQPNTPFLRLYEWSIKDNKIINKLHQYLSALSICCGLTVIVFCWCRALILFTSYVGVYNFICLLTWLTFETKNKF